MIHQLTTENRLMIAGFLDGHLRDIARPLGLPADVPVEHWRILLDYLTAPGAAPAPVRPGTLDGLRLVATDTDWSSGAGAEVTGPIEAIGMAVTGRAVALRDLSGPGAARLTPSPTGVRTGRATPRSR